jgi:hypothetical protein
MATKRFTELLSYVPIAVFLTAEAVTTSKTAEAVGQSKVDTLDAD